MIKSFSKVVVVAAMLLAFIGQALAYSAMSCDMSVDSHQSHLNMDHSSMDHSTMNHLETNESSMKHDSSNSHEECCNADCACPASACMNISIVGSEPNTAYIVRLSEGVSFQPTNQTKSISTSLYRPPIFA